MQQALYTIIDTTAGSSTTGISSSAFRGVGTSKTAKRVPARKTGLVRRLARKWDMLAVLSLIASSAAYAVFALSHTSL